jgi:hypothetical protein
LCERASFYWRMPTFLFWQGQRIIVSLHFPDGDRFWMLMVQVLTPGEW